MNVFILIIRREFALYIRGGFENLMVLAFFVMAVTLFPFGIGPEISTLGKVGAGILWVATLFSVVLSLENLFKTDYDDGSLELFGCQPLAMELIVLAKITVHWTTTGLVLILIAPILFIMMNININGYLPLLFSLALGTPSLSLIGGMGAALIVGSRRSKFLLPLIILPLYVPVLIFSISAFNSSINGAPPLPHFLILTAILLASLAICPWVSASVLRRALDN